VEAVHASPHDAGDQERVRVAAGLPCDAEAQPQRGDSRRIRNPSRTKVGHRGVNHHDGERDESDKDNIPRPWENQFRYVIEDHGF